jgi:hypothetical protein
MSRCIRWLPGSSTRQFESWLSGDGGTKTGRKGTATVPTTAPTLFGDVRSLIVEAREHAASAVNTTLARLHWLVGNRIRTEMLKSERAEYGQQILATLSQQLVVEFGNGYSYSALTRMVKFVEVARWSCTCAGWTSTNAN